jgi:hypothetical protein
MLDQSLDLLAQSDTFAIIEFLDQQENQLKVAKTYAELVKHLYWKEKNIPAMVALARAGIQYALAAGSAAFKQDLVKTLLLRGEAKSIAYNLASFTWIGWDEPGITLSATDKNYGLEAAKTNLRLAFELEKGDLRISRGYWIMAAQLLAAGELAAAKQGFQKAAVYAARDRAAADKLLACAFELLVDRLQDPHDPRLADRMDSFKNQFLSLEHGPMYIDQIDTAWRVFQSP